MSYTDYYSGASDHSDFSVEYFDFQTGGTNSVRERSVEVALTHPTEGSVQYYTITVRSHPEALPEEERDALDQQLIHLIQSIHPEDIIKYVGQKVGLSQEWVEQALSYSKATYVRIPFVPSSVAKVCDVSGKVFQEVDREKEVDREVVEVVSEVSEKNLPRIRVTDDGVITQVDHYKTKNKEKKELVQVSRRISTVDTYRDMLQKEIEHLELLASQKQEEESEWAEDRMHPAVVEQREIKKELERLRKQRTLCQDRSLEENWVTTEDFRDGLRAYQKEGMTDQEYQDFIDHQYLHVPVNMRTHECGGDVLIRCPALTDYSNGFVDAYTLAQIYREGNVEELKRVRGGVKKVCKQNKLVHNIDVVKGYALREVENLEAVQHTLKKRTNILGRQFLQLLMEHLKNADSIEDNFRLFHVGLLNQKNSSIDASGFNHNEEVEMLDTAYIFEWMQGKKIEFSNKGPLFTEEVVYLPEALGRGKKGITLAEAICVNLSVQGSLSNDPKEAQARLNQASVERIRGFVDQEREQLRSLLASAKTNEKIAADVIQWANVHGYKTSFGCFGVKDRTSVVSQTWAIRHHAEKLGRGSEEEKLARGERANMMLKGLGKQSIGGAIAQENSGELYVKSTRLKLYGMEHSPRWQIKRGWHGATKQLPQLLNDARRVRKKVKKLGKVQKLKKAEEAEEKEDGANRQRRASF